MIKREKAQDPNDDSDPADISDEVGQPWNSTGSGLGYLKLNASPIQIDEVEYICFCL